jgi:hypothetical protein
MVLSDSTATYRPAFDDRLPMQRLHKDRLLTIAKHHKHRPALPSLGAASIAQYQFHVGCSFTCISQIRTKTKGRLINGERLRDVIRGPRLPIRDHEQTAIRRAGRGSCSAPRLPRPLPLQHVPQPQSHTKPAIGTYATSTACVDLMPYTMTRWTSTHTPTGPSAGMVRRPQPLPLPSLHPPSASPACMSAAHRSNYQANGGANTHPPRSSDQRAPPFRHVNAQDSLRLHLQPSHHAEPPIFAPCSALLCRPNNAAHGYWHSAS